MSWDLLKEWWLLIVSAITAVVFSVKADLRSKNNQQDLKDMRDQRHEDITAQENQRYEDLRAQEKAREETNAVLREMRDDQREAAKTLQKFLQLIIRNQNN